MMFERLEARAGRRALERAEERREALAAELGEALPGVGAEAAEEGVRLSGRGLKRRFARDPALRWLIAEKSR
jgi:hypothetical protein